MKRIEQLLTKTHSHQKEMGNPLTLLQRQRVSKQLVKKLKESLKDKHILSRPKISIKTFEVSSKDHRVRFSIKEPQVFLIPKYINNYKMECCGNMLEIKETNVKRELMSIAKNLLQCYNHIPLKKYEALIERKYGEIKASRINFEESESRKDVIGQEEFSFQQSPKETSWLKAWEQVANLEKCDEMDKKEFELTLSSIITNTFPEQENHLSDKAFTPSKEENIINIGKEKYRFFIQDNEEKVDKSNLTKGEERFSTPDFNRNTNNLL